VGEETVTSLGNQIEHIFKVTRIVWIGHIEGTAYRGGGEIDEHIEKGAELREREREREREIC